MKKGKWWLKQEISEIFWRAEIDDNLNIQCANLIFDKIDDAIDQLDEPEQTDTNVGLSKPVIPQFVAEYIEQSKKDNDSINQVFAFMDDKEDKDLWHWLFPSMYEEKRANQEVFMRAWLDGYEVEKEKKYQVIIRDGEYIRLYLCKHGDNVMIGTNDNYIEKCPEVTYLTEQEIKDYDERYWAFAEEVTE